MIFICYLSIAIYLDCAWSVDGRRKKEIRKSQVWGPLFVIHSCLGLSVLPSYSMSLGPCKPGESLISNRASSSQSVGTDLR